MLPLLTVITGRVLIETLATAVFELRHPAELVPVTEYDVFVVGDTVKVFPVIVYVDAPEGTITNDEPEQIDPLFTVITGKLLTVTLATAVVVPTQPAALVPVTE